MTKIKLYEIKERRLELGLTQLDVAIAVGVSPEAFRNWERGASTPKEENLIKLRTVLKISDNKAVR